MEARRQRSRSVYSLIDLIDGRRLRTVRRAHRKKLRGCIYARYSTKFQDSIEDQVRTCRKWAEEHDIEVTDVHVYSDVARTGKARRRKGLEAMLAALDRGEIDVVITFATNRLNRRIHLALQFVEEEIVEKRRRCVFVAQNIDTEDTKFWKQLLYVFAMVDEFQVQMSAGHIRAAHIGLLLKRRIHGTLTFGYTGVPIPGEFTRRGHPQRRWEINPETQDWVKQIFEWYVFEHRRFRWIARELRKRHAPPPPKVERWSRGAVRHVLTNRRYIGDWSYGWRETVWQSKADYGRQYLKDKPTQEHREESLRIISDSLFYAAQERLNKRRGSGGRPSSKGERSRDPMLDLMWCPKHQRYLRPYSGDGHLLACPKCKAGDGEEPCLFSVLNRDIARRILYTELAKRIRQTPNLVEMVIEAARRQIEGLQSPDKSRIESLERELRSVSNKIQFVLDNPGETDTDRAENARQISQLRAQRSGIERQLAEQRQIASTRREPPSVDEVRGLVDQIAQILEQGTIGGDEEQAGKVMRMVLALTGGKIELCQQGEARAKRGWLRGTFRVRLLDTLLSQTGCQPSAQEGEEVVLDFRVGNATVDEQAEKAVQKLASGILMCEVAKQMGIVKSRLTQLVRRWHEARGLPVPDGRSRRQTLERKSVEPQIFQQAADKVMELVDQGLLFDEIAEQLKLDRNTITAAVKYWHEQRALPVPDGRRRRKELSRKSRGWKSRQSGTLDAYNADDVSS